jgi:hypothetical protein
MKVKKRIFFMTRHGSPGTNPTERWSDGVLAFPITPPLHHSIPDQFTHVYDSGPEILFFNRVIRLFSIFCGKSSQVPLHQLLMHEIRVSSVKPSQAWSNLIVPLFEPKCPGNPSRPYLTILLRIAPSAHEPVPLLCAPSAASYLYDR